MSKNNMTKKYTTDLSKNTVVAGLTINSRKYPDSGDPIEYSAIRTINKNNEEDYICRTIDQNTVNGGKVTPFNFLPNARGACAVRDIVRDGDATVVVFADGDRVALKRYAGDKDDPVTSVLWAIGQKAFGVDLARQINRAIRNRTIDVAKLRAENGKPPVVTKIVAKKSAKKTIKSSSKNK